MFVCSHNSKHVIVFSPVSVLAKHCGKYVCMGQCFVSSLTAKQALNGVQIQNCTIEANSLKIPDLARDESAVDVNRIEKYFVNEGWSIVLGALAKKRKFPWICPGCTKGIKTSQNSVACERCLNWYHFSCLSLQKKPKTKYWLCRNCKNKYR